MASTRLERFPFPKLQHLWAGFPFLLVLLKGFITPLPLLDFWWHLKTGQIIVEQYAIPRLDAFSFTASGKVFVIQNWLAEVIFYGLYRAGGFPLLVFANSLLTALTIAPIYLLCRRFSSSKAASVFSVTLLAVCIPTHMRPQIFSYLLFALFYWLVLSYREGKHNLIWWLPALMVCWVNLHGAFILGIVVLAIVFICAIVNCFFAEGAGVLKNRKVLLLGLILLLCSLATLANPEGYRVYEYLRTVGNDPASQSFVTEWQPPVVLQINGLVVFYASLFLATFALIASERRPDLTTLAMYAVFSVFGLTALRNGPWFLLVSAPLIARYLPHIGYRRLLGLPNTLPEPVEREAPQRPKQSVLLNLAIVVAACFGLFVRSPWMHKDLLLDRNTPVAAMDFIARNQIKGNMYHPQIYGDYLIWRLWPLQRSFIDGRVHLFGESFVKLYWKTLTDSHWEDLLKKYNIQYLLLTKGEIGSEERQKVEAVRKSAKWKSVYEDSLSVLFARARQ